MDDSQFDLSRLIVSVRNRDAKNKHKQRVLELQLATSELKVNGFLADLLSACTQFKEEIDLDSEVEPEAAAAFERLESAVENVFFGPSADEWLRYGAWRYATQQQRDIEYAVDEAEARDGSIEITEDDL